MKLTLYQYPGGDGVGSVSPPCFKVELVLRLLGVDHDVVDLTSPRKVSEGSARFIRALFGRMKAPARWVVPRMFVSRQRRRARLHGSGHRGQRDIVEEIVHALDMAVAALGEGPFLQGRRSPGRGDLALASLLAQAGFRGTMPEIHRQVEARPPLVAHMREVFSACDFEVPRRR